MPSITFWNCQPNRPSRKPCSRSASPAGHSTWVTCGISAPFLERDLDDAFEAIRFGTVSPAFVDRECDREVLHRKAGGVEKRDVVVAPPAFFVAGEDAAELGYVFPAQAGRERVADVAVVARLLPLVADDSGPQELLVRDLRFSGAVGAHEACMLSRLQRVRFEDDLVAGRDRDDDVGAERLLFARRDPGALAELRCGGLCGFVPCVPEENLSLSGEERGPHRAPVHPRADNCRWTGARPRERLRREDRGGPGAKRCDGACIEKGSQLPGRSVGEEDDAGDRRQSALRVPREGRHPFQNGVARPGRGHRAEIAAVDGHVHLRRHRPVPARVLDERLADGLDGVPGRERGADVRGGEEGYAHGGEVMAAQGTICDVGPRDGLQNEADTLHPETRADLVNRLASAGLRSIEAVSFVSAERVPQMGGAEQVVGALERRDGVVYSGLVLNERGYERLVATGLDAVHFTLGATETFNRRNANRSVDESVAELERIETDLPVSVSLSVSFGCPFEGAVDPAGVLELAERCIAGGAGEIVFADTIGVGVPGQARHLVSAAQGLGVPVGVHLHNTRNTGFANAYAALQAGATVFESSVGGLGGCPFAPRATGNIATEDLVYLLHGEGVGTGVDLDGLIGVAQWLEGILGRDLPGQVYRAGAAVAG